MASSVATPLEQQFAAIPGLSQMTSTSGLGATSITLQFDLEPQHRRRRRSDVQTAINAAGGLLPKNLPNPPTYRKTNPAGPADPDLRASTPTTCRSTRSTNTPTRFWRRRCRPFPASRQVIIAGQQKYAVHVQVDPGGPGGARHRPRGRPQRARQHPTRPAQGQSRERAAGLTLDTNDQLFDRRGLQQVIVAYRNGAPVRVARHRRGRSIPSSNPRTAPGSTRKPRRTAA